MSAAVAYRGNVGQTFGTLFATAKADMRRRNAYLIEVIRHPLYPLLYFGTTYLAYSLAGRQTVGGVNLAGFLLVGLIGMETWEASVWTSGYAIEEERYTGTIAALFLTPAQRLPIVAGYGLGGFVFALPTFAVIGLLGLFCGAQFQVTSWVAVGLSIAALALASITVGFLLAGLFVLTRRANLLANVIQHPISLLGGFVVAPDQLPHWLRPLADALPFTHALNALRASMLSGATLTQMRGELLWTLGISALCMALGAIGIRKVEHVAKRSGQLELF